MTLPLDADSFDAAGQEPVAWDRGGPSPGRRRTDGAPPLRLLPGGAEDGPPNGRRTRADRRVAGPRARTDGARVRAHARAGRSSARALGPTGGFGGGGRRRGGHRIRNSLVVLVVVVIVLGVVQLLRGVPRPVVAQTVATTDRLPGSPPSIPWPSEGEAALAVQGMGMIGTYGTQSELPIGSIAKLFGAMVILQDHPLARGANGPSITFNAADAQLYRTEKADADSVFPVVAGESLTERQALEALLIPSADNLAVNLAQWDAGSSSAFVAKMNALVAKLGLHHTHFSDPSGLSTGSVSSAEDLTRFGEYAWKNRIIRHISEMPQVTLPVGNGVSKTVYNYNYDLGKDGIIGIKTGSTPQAGGCFVFAARETIAGQSRLVFGAVLGQYSASSPLQKALNEALLLVQSVSGVAEQVRIVPSGAEVGQVSVPWGKAVPLVTKGSVDLLVPTGATAKLELSAHLPGDTVAAGTKVGTLRVIVGGHTSTVPVVTGGALSPPTVGWRLRRL